MPGDSLSRAPHAPRCSTGRAASPIVAGNELDRGDGVRLYVLLALALFSGTAVAQQIETPPAPKDEAKPVGYLPAGTLNFADIVKGPPALGSPEEAIDFRTVAEAQRAVTPERWKVAEGDDQFLLARFGEALGVTIDRATLPRTVRLLNRALRDSYAVSTEAKNHHARMRPFQRVQVDKMCNLATALPPEPVPKTRSSYPSGHSTWGWTTALVLTDVAPEKAPALFFRARDYAESRYICAWHFPTDVEAGKLVATAVVARLERDPTFRKDLACAAAEYRNVTRGEKMPKGC
jgi:acid phosphatase (class A)